MIASDSPCNHIDGDPPSHCYAHLPSSDSIVQCEASCTNKASCIGYMYRFVDTQSHKACILFPNDGTCPSGFTFYSQSNTAKTMNELVAHSPPITGYVCYGKNSGKGFLLFEKYI